MMLMHSIKSSKPSSPHTHVWTRDEYYAMGEAGLFRNRRVQLIEGEIIDMNSIGPRHAAVVTMGAVVLPRVGLGTYVRSQQPLFLSEISEPEPDLALFRGSPIDFAKAHPMTALLVVEVADSSLKFDLEIKSALYARQQIQDYWVFELVNDLVHVHRKPYVTDDQDDVWGYGEVRRFGKGESVSPLEFPQTVFSVSELLVCHD